MPFFTYFGGKWRVAPKYPGPLHETIIEPFAGAAGYAVRHAERRVILVERDPKIAAVWRYLLTASPADIRGLPLWGQGWMTTDDLSDFDIGARYLIGLWLNKGTASPRKSPSRWMRDGLRPNSLWGAVIRERIASQVDHIRHWTLIEGDYSDAPEREATWFIDPPYTLAGSHYPSGSKGIDYPALSDWCQARAGQVMVCEAAGADWLPFAPFASIKGTEGCNRDGKSHEVLWTNGVNGDLFDLVSSPGKTAGGEG